MSVIETIKSRQSIRKYLDKAVPQEVLQDIIEAARLAPSGRNTQGWAYKVVVAKEVITELKKNNIFPQGFVYTAPALVFCCYDHTVYKENFENGEEIELETKSRLPAVRDLSIASSYLMLRSEELGFGTCYIGWMDKKNAKETLKIPESMEVLFAITVGYPDEQPVRKPRKAIDEIMLK